MTCRRSTTPSGLWTELEPVVCEILPSLLASLRGCDFFAPELVSGVQRPLRDSDSPMNSISAKVVEPPTQVRRRKNHSMSVMNRKPRIKTMRLLRFSQILDEPGSSQFGKNCGIIDRLTDFGSQ